MFMRQTRFHRQGGISAYKGIGLVFFTNIVDKTTDASIFIAFLYI